MVTTSQKYLFSIDTKTSNENHIFMSNSLITEAYRLAHQKRALILGCGQCKEIPVKSLIPLSAIDLVDIDSKYLQQLMDGFIASGTDLKRTCFFTEDITGLIASLSQELEKYLETSSNGVNGSLETLIKIINNAKPVFWTTPAGYRYTFIICSLVLTQFQAFILSKLEKIFLKYYPKSRDMLCNYQDWIKAKYRFARRLEDSFVAHLKILAEAEAIIYVSDTVRVCFVKHTSNGLYSTEGSWITLKTNRLSDYFNTGYKVIKETSWYWFLPKIEENSDGRLYEVQAVILKCKE